MRVPADATLAQVTRELVGVLGTLACESESATLIARRAGFPPAHLPVFKEADTFWKLVLEQVALGRTAPDVLRALIEEALGRFPHNAKLAELRESVASAGGSSSGAVAVAIDSVGPARKHGAGTSRTAVGAIGAGLVGTVLATQLFIDRQVESPAVYAEDAAIPEAELEPELEIRPPLVDGSSFLAVAPGATAPPLEPPSSCLRDADCGAGFGCQSQVRSIKKVLGTVVKAIDRGSHTQIIGHDCVEGMKRMGRPRAKVTSRSSVECRAEWRVPDERSCEVDVLVLGPAWEEVRCDVTVTLQRRGTHRRRCTPLAKGE